LKEAISAIEKRINSKMPGIIKNEQRSSAQSSLIAVWEVVVPLVNEMNNAMIIKNDYLKIDELKMLRSKTHQLVTLYESKLPVISENVREITESLIDKICNFYDKSVWVCSLERTSKGLTGDILAKYSIGILNSSSQMEHLLQDIRPLYDSMKKIVCD
jgi:hypothetical protein